MDRNNISTNNHVGIREVALRKESVDRNLNAVQIVVVIMVALRKESVDRNFCYADKDVDWVRVALRKESVDRNHAADISARREARSLSARRAWIEIWLGIA